MSEGYADLFQRAAGLFEAGDWDGLGALVTEDAGWWAMEGWPEPGPFIGRTAVVDEFRRLHESWGANRVLIEEQIEHDDWLVVRLRWIVKGATSGVPGDMTIFTAVRFEGAQIAEYRAFWNRTEALEAAGLSE